jgi:hypothetical protein
MSIHKSRGTNYSFGDGKKHLVGNNTYVESDRVSSCGCVRVYSKRYRQGIWVHAHCLALVTEPEFVKGDVVKVSKHKNVADYYAPSLDPKKVTWHELMDSYIGRSGEIKDEVNLGSKGQAYLVKFSDGETYHFYPWSLVAADEPGYMVGDIIQVSDGTQGEIKAKGKRFHVKWSGRGSFYYNEQELDILGATVVQRNPVELPPVGQPKGERHIIRKGDTVRVRSDGHAIWRELPGDKSPIWDQHFHGSHTGMSGTVEAVDGKIIHVEFHEAPEGHGGSKYRLSFHSACLAVKLTAEESMKRIHDNEVLNNIEAITNKGINMKYKVGKKDGNFSVIDHQKNEVITKGDGHDNLEAALDEMGKLIVADAQKEAEERVKAAKHVRLMNEYEIIATDSDVCNG